MEQRYFDDGVEGIFRATLSGGILEITLQDIPAEHFRIYAPDEIREVRINGEIRPATRDGSCCLV